MADQATGDLDLETVLQAADEFPFQPDGTPGTRHKAATFALMGGLEVNYSAAEDSNVSMAVGTRYVRDISGYATANRDFTLPTTHALGERVAISLEVGDATYAIVVKTGAGNTCAYNGMTIAASSEVERLFNTGETLVFESVEADTTWQCVLRSLHASNARVENNGSTGTQQITESSSTSINTTVLDTTAYNTGWTITSSGGARQMKARRDGKVFVHGIIHYTDTTGLTIAEGDFSQLSCFVGGVDTIKGQGHPMNTASSGKHNSIVVNGIIDIATDDLITIDMWYKDDSASGSYVETIANAAKCNFTVTEIV